MQVQYYQLLAEPRLPRKAVQATDIPLAIPPLVEAVTVVISGEGGEGILCFRYFCFL